MSSPMSVGERIRELLSHLGIDEAHFAARMPEDWCSVTDHCPEVVKSLTLVAPTSLDRRALKSISGSVCILGESEPDNTDDMEFVQLAAGTCTFWGEVVGKNAEVVQKCLTKLSSKPSTGSEGTETPQYTQGSHGGISYKTAGTGPALVLLPLALATDGWTAIMDTLANHFQVLVLGGKHLGLVPILEHRGFSDGYAGMMDAVLDNFEWAQPGSSILEVGSGTGVVLRRAASRVPGSCTLTGVDLNAYLVNEAASIARKDECSNVSFKVGNATQLPFPDAHFDAVFSTTVGEEVDADKMMSEMHRVCKPGGFLAVIVRSEDIPPTVTINLSDADLAKFSSGPYNTEEAEADGSCASRSLYRRFQRVPGVVLDKCGIHAANFRNRKGAIETFALRRFLMELPPDENARWTQALAEAEADGTFVLAWFHHYVTGRKADTA